MHNIISYVFLITTILGALGLIIIVYSRTSEKYSARLFILTLIFVIAYVISHGLHFYMLVDTDLLLLDQSCHSLLLLIVISLTFFTISFPENKHVSLIESIVILVPSSILFVLLWTGELIIESHSHIQQFEAHYNYKYPVFLIWYILLIFYSLFSLVIKFNETKEGKIKRQILIMFFGLLITNLTSFVFGLLLPWVLGFYYLVEISPFAFLIGVILFTALGIGRFDIFPNALTRVRYFSLNRKIFLSTVIAVPLVIVIVQIPMGRVLFGISTSEEWGRYFLISLTGGIIVSITISFIILKIIANPISKLKDNIEKIKQGEYGTVVDISSNDEIGELAYTFNDMSLALKSDSEELKIKEKRIAMLMNAFDKSFTLIALVDSKFNIIQTNKIFCEINCTDEKKVLGKSIEEIQFIESRNLFDKIKSELISKNQYEGEISLNRGNNKRELLISVTPFEIDENSSGYLFVEVDITTVRSLEIKLALSERLAAIGRMAAVLAHEVKTPLTSIKMNADMLTESLQLNEDDQKSFQIIQKEIERLKNLVNEVLNLTRQQELKTSWFDLRKMIEEIDVNSNSIFVKKNFNILNNIKNLKILADKEKIRQVFINLINNAFESADERGTIKILSEVLNNKVKIIFVDDGPGIQEEIADKIFEPFFTTKHSGTGLGLAISKKIMQQHSGDINLVDDNGRYRFELVFNDFEEGN